MAAVVLDSGERIDADLVIIGIVPNAELAAAAQLDIDNGIVVDTLCSRKRRLRPASLQTGKNSQIPTCR